MKTCANDSRIEKVSFCKPIDLYQIAPDAIMEMGGSFHHKTVTTSGPFLQKKKEVTWSFAHQSLWIPGAVSRVESHVHSSVSDGGLLAMVPTVGNSARRSFTWLLHSTYDWNSGSFTWCDSNCDCDCDCDRLTRWGYIALKAGSHQTTVSLFP